jgi:hypothetical protein
LNRGVRFDGNSEIEASVITSITASKEKPAKVRRKLSDYFAGVSLLFASFFMRPAPLLLSILFTLGLLTCLVAESRYKKERQSAIEFKTEKTDMPKSIVQTTPFEFKCQTTVSSTPKEVVG